MLLLIVKVREDRFVPLVVIPNEHNKVDGEPLGNGLDKEFDQFELINDK